MAVVDYVGNQLEYELAPNDVLRSPVDTKEGHLQGVILSDKNVKLRPVVIIDDGVGPLEDDTSIKANEATRFIWTITTSRMAVEVVNDSGSTATVQFDVSVRGTI